MLARIRSVRPRTLALVALATLVLGGLVFGVWPLPQAQELGGGPVPDARGFASGREAAGYIDALGGSGRRLYATMLAGDIVWTVLHGLTVAASIAVGFTRSRLADNLAGLAALPLAAAALDVIENVSFLAAIAAHPGPPPVPASIMGVLTGTKYVLLVLAYLALLWALVAWRRSRPQPG